MGSGGSHTLWSPSYEAGAYRLLVLKIDAHLLTHFPRKTLTHFNNYQAFVDDYPLSQTLYNSIVIDGGTLKRE